MKALIAAALTALTLTVAVAASASTVPASYRFSCVAAKASLCDGRLNLRRALGIHYHLGGLYQAETACVRSSRYMVRYRCSFGGGAPSQFGAATVTVTKGTGAGRWRVTVTVTKDQ